MKVDMSPEAVTARFRELNDLWVLTVKLKNSSKVSVEAFHLEKVAKSHPISGLVKDWFFRVNEESANNFLAEGVDLFGRKVSHRGADYEETLERCVTYAKQTCGS